MGMVLKIRVLNNETSSRRRSIRGKQLNYAHVLSLIISIVSTEYSLKSLLSLPGVSSSASLLGTSRALTSSADSPELVSFSVPPFFFGLGK